MSAPHLISDKYSIQPVEKRDLAFLAEFLHTCKMALPINRLLFVDWPNDAAQKPLYRKAIEGAFADETVESWKVVIDDDGNINDSGDKSAILGYLCLSRKRPANTSIAPGTSISSTTELESEPEPEPEPMPPSTEKGTREKDSTDTTPPGIDPAVLSAVSQAVAELEKGTENIDHFELTYVCVQPSFRRRGIASQLLVKRCFERARAEGLPLILCAEPAARDFFVALGFRDTRHIDIDLARWAPPRSGFGVFRLSSMIWRPEFEG